MAWQIRSKARSVLPTISAFRSFTIHEDRFRFYPYHGVYNPFSAFTRSWPSRAREKLEEVEDSKLRLISFPQENPRVGVDASPKNSKLQDMLKTDGERELFDELKRRFLNFKKEKYLKERDHFQILAENQSPKFMVIACVDSRVCPSNILGFQPGEAFMVRNVANLVPALENGPTETNAALEFAVNTLEVEHILVIGHSSCAGIQALMTMQDGRNSSFVEKWVAFAKVAKLRTKSEAANLSFHEQCRHCEKESINNSLVNLLSYPWIEDRVRKGLVCIHGGYYDFLECTFEKWTLDWKGSRIGESSRTVLVKDRVLWC
ncbi:hypothetical protein K2173_007952 [Erythroxylum novogranatense]|uniref:Carbonic anhydrase n=1 Tax=Erythroxylum novogranatense TaxID=1862640 RepID=A0AAV8T8F6_9ROSI|nr:hypothetical protein K2173_007952 [Erythroxylum novogranatense]